MNQQIQEVGYDPDTGKVYPATVYSDFMSYCWLNMWISPFRWSQQFGWSPASAQGGAPAIAPAPALQEAVGILASIDNPDLPGGPSNGLQAFRTGGGGNVVAPPAGDEYRVELRDGASVLAGQSFGASFENPEDPGAPPESSLIAFSMPWAEGTTSLALLRGSEALATLSVSAHAPVVTVTSPSAQEVWASGSSHTITWTGGDEDGDSLTYSLFYAPDGSSYVVLETGLTGTSFEVQTDSLAGGGGAKFRVLASDGVNTGYGDSAPVFVPNKVPLLSVTSPEDNTVVAVGGLVVLNGYATDLEDGPLPDGGLEWSSDLDGALGTGPSLPLNTLSKGVHEITLRATDSGSASGEATITVAVGMVAGLDVLPENVSPRGAPDELRAIVTLPPGYSTDLIDQASLRVRIGDGLVTPGNVESLGDTDEDGLPELELTLDGAAVQALLPAGLAAVDATLEGELNDGTLLGGKDVIVLIVPGDVDCDGAVDSVDALMVLRHAAGLGEPDCLLAGDVNCAGGINSVDALQVLRHVAGLPLTGLAADCAGIAAESSLPPGEPVGAGAANADGPRAWPLAAGAWGGVAPAVPGVAALRSADAGRAPMRSGAGRGSPTPARAERGPWRASRGRPGLRRRRARLRSRSRP